LSIVALITGASGGIGRELCQRFIQHGCVTIAVSRNPPMLAADANYHPLKLDITGVDAGKAMAEAAAKWEDAHFRILIHNAGLLSRKDFVALSDFELEQMTAVNFLAPLKITRDLIPWLQGGDCAHIIYVGSMAGFQGSRKYPGLAAYTALKSAGSGLMEGLAAEFKGSSLHFNTLALGAVQTEMLQQAFPEEKGLSPAEMADFICYFALNGWKFFNGKALPVSQEDPF
jgi:NAD(P)-dependent dehydrogenase (short-subunit alcohol dehydrogenase family)